MDSANRKHASRIVGLRWLALLLMLIGVIGSAAPVAAEDDVTWKSYDVTLDVQPDGVVHVTEAIVAEFNGSFSHGHRSIPMTRIDAIENVTVAVGDDSGNTAPTTFTTLTSDGDFVIDYDFEMTNETNIRAIVLEYDAIGVIRVYPDNDPPRQEIRWTAISSEVTAVGPIDRASATINFPESTEGSAATRFDPEPTSIAATSVTWEKSGMGDGDALLTFASFPAMTTATEPTWQAEADRLEPRREKVPALAILTGLVTAVGFGLLGLFMWRDGIRDPAVGLVADILPTPPDDLPAGMVGALIDETLDAKDVIGMLVDMDRRGIVEISEDSDASSKKEDDPTRFHIELKQDVDAAPAWAAAMLEGLFGKNAGAGASISFKPLKDLAAKHKGSISKSVEQELFSQGYYDELPTTTRVRWILRAVAGLVIAAIPVAAIALWTKAFSGWLIAASVVAGVMFVGVAVMSYWSPRKSLKGAETAAKWKAFGRYLKQMEKEMPQQERLALFDEYLPWAIVLGFDKSSWGKWMKDDDNYRWGSRQYRPWDPTWQQRYGRGDFDRGRPDRNSGSGSSFDMQGMSNRGMSGINAANLSMFAMLNSASSTFASGSSSSGSGSGGGSASVGSSGGGGHSFS